MQVVTGDTKVVEKGSGDQLFINTTGIGLVPEGLELSADTRGPATRSCSADTSATTALPYWRSARGSNSSRQSKATARLSTAWWRRCSGQVPGSRGAIRCMRDPTRGGLSSTLNEIAEQSKVGIQIEERAIPIREEVRGACEMLGLDPLYVANEGKLIAIVAPAAAEPILEAMRRHPLGRNRASSERSRRVHPERSSCGLRSARPELSICWPAISCPESVEVFMVVMYEMGIARHAIMLGVEKRHSGREVFMHEMGIACSILDAVAKAVANNAVDKQARRHPGVRATRVGVRIGELAAIDPEALRFCFEVMVKGTEQDGLQLEIERVPRQHQCAGLPRGICHP